jgi:hypothetical protein
MHRPYKTTTNIWMTEHARNAFLKYPPISTYRRGLQPRNEEQRKAGKHSAAASANGRDVATRGDCLHDVITVYLIWSS